MNDKTQKTLIISRQEDIICIQREDGDYEHNPVVKLFTYRDGMKIMAEIAITFLDIFRS